MSPLSPISPSGFRPPVAKSLELTTEQEEVLQQTELKDAGVATSLSTDSAEEMAEAGAQFNKTATQRRDYEKKHGALEGEYSRVLDDKAASKANEILAHLRASKAALAELKRFAQQQFPDPSDLILVLRTLIRQQDLDPAEKALLEALLTEVEEESDPKTTKAGINIALKARLFGSRLAFNPSALRHCYRQFLQHFQLAVPLYQGWIDDFGFERRAGVLEFIESALFSDMHANDPSCSRFEFGECILSLRILRLLRSSDQLFLTLLHAGPEAGVRLMLNMLLDPYLIETALSSWLGDEYAGLEKRRRSKLLQALRRAVRKIPLELFVVEDTREFVLDVLANEADQAYDAESGKNHPFGVFKKELKLQ